MEPSTKNITEISHTEDLGDSGNNSLSVAFISGVLLCYGILAILIFQEKIKVFAFNINAPYLGLIIMATSFAAVSLFITFIFSVGCAIKCNNNP